MDLIPWSKWEPAFSPQKDETILLSARAYTVFGFPAGGPNTSTLYLTTKRVHFYERRSTWQGFGARTLDIALSDIERIDRGTFFTRMPGWTIGVRMRNGKQHTFTFEGLSRFVESPVDEYVYQLRLLIPNLRVDL